MPTFVLILVFHVMIETAKLKVLQAAREVKVIQAVLIAI